MALKIKGQTVIDDDRGLGDISQIGIGTTANPTGAKLLVDVGSGVTAVTVQGSEGQLFSVTNELTTGSIFSVNDISGIPSIDVDADGTILVAPYSTTEKVGIGTTNPSYKLHVEGDIKLADTGTLWFSDTSGSIEKIVATTSTLDYYSDSKHRFYESDNTTERVTFDVNNASGRLYFDGDSNTYFTREATDCHVFVNAGSESVRINASGDVGIGQTNPSSHLHIGPYNGNDTSHLYLASGNNSYGWRFDTQDFGAGSVPLRIFRRLGGTDTEVITVLNQNGNLGIGVTIPGAKLEVRDASATGIIVRSNSTQSTNTNKALRVRNNSDTNTFHVSHKGQGYFAGSVGIGTDNPSSELHLSAGTGTQTIRVDTDGTALSIHNHSEFIGYIGNDAGKFFINAGGTEDNLLLRTNGTERVRIDSAGDVGIGTDNPQYKLHVIGDTNIDGTFTVNGSPVSGGGGGVGYFTTTTNGINYTGIGTISAVGIGTKIEIVPYDTQNSGTLSFEASAGQLFSITNNLTTGSIFSVNDVSGIPSIDVDADGTVLVAPYSTTEKVGIGTTNPQYKLHVIGNTNIDGTFTVNGSPVSGGSVAGSDGQIQYNNGGSSGGASQLYYDDVNNRVGINTATPAYKLDVFDQDGAVLRSGSDTFRVNQTHTSWTNTTYADNPIIMWDWKTGPGDHIFFASGGNTAVGDQMAMVISDNHGFKVGKNGYDGTDTDVDSNNEFFRVTNTGDVGIGTDIPTSKLHVVGDMRVTGIATFGTSSTTIDGDQNVINVGTALTLGHTQGLQFHTQNLHSSGFEVNNINSTGIITASSFVKSGGTSSQYLMADGSTSTGGGGGSSTLSGLTDVTISTPSSGQVLKYNGSAWVNDTDATGSGGGGGTVDLLEVMLFSS
jgi:hypothetical protein